MTKRKQFQAEALKDSKDKSVLVERRILKMDPIYKKRYFSMRKMQVATDQEVKKGQQVVVEETRPMSRRIAWKVVAVK